MLTRRCRHCLRAIEITEPEIPDVHPCPSPHMLAPTKPMLFLASTAAKAWEPLSVSVASKNAAPYLFPAALVGSEAIKLVVLLPIMLVQRQQAACNVQPSRLETSNLLRSASRYGTAAGALAICNLCLGHAVPRLGAMLYQVAFQCVTVLATAGLSYLLLQQPLTTGQWNALGLVTAGSLGVVRVTARGGATAATAPSLAAFLACVVGAVTFSLSTVLSERAAQRAPAQDSVLEQAFAFSAWGLVATLVALALLHGRDIAAGVGTSPLSGFFVRPAAGPWGVAASIAAADLTMTVFCMVDGLGANAYSISRAMGMVCTPLLASLALGTSCSVGFCAFSALVALGGLLFARSKER